MYNKKIAIWGTGAVAERFYLWNKGNFNIVCFFDNNEKKHNTTFCNLPIRKWETESLKDYFIIIASTFYIDIINQLERLGLLYGTSFILWKHFEKKRFIEYETIYELIKYTNTFNWENFPRKRLAVVFGNCQTRVIERAFLLHNEFTHDYTIIQAPDLIDTYQKELVDYFGQDVGFWNSVELFVYQTISSNNRFSEYIATEKILKLLPSICKKVNILNLYFTGYFPQMYKHRKPRIGGGRAAVFHRDRYIDFLLKQGENEKEIVRKVMSEDFILTDEIFENACESLNELRKREHDVDIPMVDYIEENYKKYQLFYSENHPTYKVLMEEINRIFEYLGYNKLDISESDFISSCGYLKGQDIPIYPSVIKSFGLKEYEKKYYPNRYCIDSILLNFEEFIKFYIKFR